MVQTGKLMRLVGVLRGLVIAWGLTAGVLPASAALVSATLPGSRSVQVGDPATLFATVINSGSDALSGCGVSLSSSINAELFFQTTDPATNALTGERDQRVAIAAGAAQSFLIGVVPNEVLAPTPVAFEFSCDQGTPAASIEGLNTLLLSASTTPVPDIVAIALTPSQDGVATLPQDSGLGFLALATVNVGSGADIRVRARLPEGAEGALLVCETNPMDGSCLQPPAPVLDVRIDASGTPTFAVFASTVLRQPLDPAGRRLFVEFIDEADVIRGSTSVAVAGGGPSIANAIRANSAGQIVLPDGPATRQVDWLLSQLAEDATTLAEIQARFSSGSATGWQSFLDQLRTEGYRDARVLDVLFATPVSVGFIMGTGAPGAVQGFVQVQTDYNRGGLINFFQVSPYGGTVQFVRDQTLTMEQAADDFMATGTDNALLIARITSDGQCEPILEREAETPRALASVFKMWVLGAVGQAVNDGVVSLQQSVPLQAALFGQGGTINSEPLGTEFPLQDMATLMMGISDNTATDHLHALAGRARVDATVTAFGNDNPDDMLPLLSISQAFSLYYSFPLADSLSYVNGTEAEQRSFLENRILPVGAVNGGPFFHNSLLVDAFVKASALDTCRAISSLRRFPPTSEGFDLIDKAMSAGAAQPGLRGVWDRVWYKGGNLVGNSEQRVLTHAWLLESAEHGQFAVVALGNSRVSGNIDTFEVQSLTARLMTLLAESVLQ